MKEHINHGLTKSQALVHCRSKAMLYTVGMSIGKRIRLARCRLGMGQEELANAIGVSKQAVFEWEKKGKQPTADKLPLLRQTLRVTFAWLIVGDGPPPEPDSPEVLMDNWMVTAYQKKLPKAG